jgi:hypothetical protein
MRGTALLSLAMLLLVSAFGCGSSGGNSTTTQTVTQQGGPLSKPQFIAKAGAICQAAQSDSAAPIAKAGAALKQGDNAAAADATQQISDRLRQMVDDLKALPQPAGDEAILTGLFDRFDGEIGILNQIVEAERNGDSARASSLSDAINSSDKELQGIVTGYGLQGCGA